MRNEILIASSIAAALLFSSCATLLNGTRQGIAVSTAPEAWVYVYDDMDQLISKTVSPGVVQLSRKCGNMGYAYKIVIYRKGYKMETYFIQCMTNTTSLIGNLIFGSLLGYAIDLATGAFWTLSPDVINIALE